MFLKQCTYELIIFHPNRTTRCLEEPRQNKGQGLVDRKLHVVEDPRKFTAGSLKAILLFWFFGGFRCGVWLFLVFLLDIKPENK